MTHLEIASKFIGQKEQPGNRFDNETILGRILKDAGHKDGEAWCAYFAEAIFVETLRSLFSASCVQTFRNFKKAGYEISQKPKVGWLVVWQRYKDSKPTWQGHMGIVTCVNEDDSFHSVEGNTDKAGSRTGGSVQENPHESIYPTDPGDGLKLLGFIKIF